MTTRRGFIGGILALAAAPSLVRVDSLMKLARSPVDLGGAMLADHTAWLQAQIDIAAAAQRPLTLAHGVYGIGAALVIPPGFVFMGGGSTIEAAHGDRPMLIFQKSGAGSSSSEFNFLRRVASDQPLILTQSEG